MATRIPRKLDPDQLFYEGLMSGNTTMAVAYALNRVADATDNVSSAIEDVAKAIEKSAGHLSEMATHMKYLGTGDAATTQGALELVAQETMNGFEKVADALQRLATAVEEKSDPT